MLGKGEGIAGSQLASPMIVSSGWKRMKQIGSFIYQFHPL
jgi:hypothetical protein